jgi:prevent-host-death family protein
MIKYVSSREARANFAHLLGEVHYGGQTVIVKRSGRPMVAIIPVEEYERLVSEREARFQILDDIRSRMPDIPPEQAEQDVAEAVAAARATDAASRS